MSACATIDAFDVTFRLFAPTDRSLSEAVEELPAAWRIGGGTGGECARFDASWTREERVHRLVIGERLAIASRRGDDLLSRLPSALEGEVASRSAKTLLHAGVVATPSGAILLPGLSFSGKSRLVRALVEAGAEYYSDDLAPLDSGGRVEAAGNPLTIRHSDHRRTTVAAASLGWNEGMGACPVRLVYFGRFRPGAIFAPRLLSESQATMRLLANTISSTREQFMVLSRVARRSMVIACDRGEATTAARQLMSLLAGEDVSLPCTS